MKSPAIEARDLCKAFQGDHGKPPVKAVDHIDFLVPQGATVGLLGGNGAGKTTTIAMLMGLTTPTY